MIPFFVFFCLLAFIIITNTISNEQFDDKLYRYKLVNKSCRGKKECLYCNNNVNKKTKCGCLSLYDEDYIKNNQIYCYNCILDENIKQFYNNPCNFPFSNGPPNVSFFI